MKTIVKVVSTCFAIAFVATSTVQAKTIKEYAKDSNGFDVAAARTDNSFALPRPDESAILTTDKEVLTAKAEKERLEAKAKNIESYFRKINAPLADYAKEIVIAGEKYGVDPELIAAISVIESGGGKVNFRPYNAWGWGKSGFSSWEEAIDSYTRGLAKGYISRGLDDPYEIAPFYCPPNKHNWARNVSSVKAKIEAGVF